METIELLSRFADPEVMKTLSLADRMVAGLITTVLGMGITFVSLVILQVVIALMAKFSAAGDEVKETKPEAEKTVAPAANEERLLDDEELVAAISTALALQLKTSVSNIVIRNIERVEDPTPIWHRAGIAEHMNKSV